ncbi:hypothetical protein B0T19DRAFT_270056 [Cercophora scortea]|uniref:Nephrocystin 3-like N-terminal domain-containing protein n=1 Tax=Cercophora scortea TaxID=314031 RepID=A0AAE0M502_9PEZI|nr:hypothetical protein B0T19DRAFT_270056 [Cercophora scortea]
MDSLEWTRRVFRLRMIPNRVSSPADAATLLSKVLGITTDQIIVYSLAITPNNWESPPSRIATLRFKLVPPSLRDCMTQSEWRVSLPGAGHGDDLILDTHFQGMTTLNDVDPARHSVDCIAISGLASHPFGSWQPRGSDKTFMWIRDSLPLVVPGARAIIYGYDSDLMEAHSFQTISDIATSLILHLKAGDWNLPSSKPVIFLAHSLGGIVLKDAIVQAADREKSISGILDRVLGALMFGVPNLGMDQSQLMAMVEGQANEALIRDLSGESSNRYLRQLNTQFDGLSFTRTAQILWAYETKESNTVIQLPDGTWNKQGTPTVLVSPDSATNNQCRKDKSVTIPINRDHSNMVKFSRGDAQLGIVLSSIIEVCSKRLPIWAGASNLAHSSNKIGLISSSTHDTAMHTASTTGDFSDDLKVLGQLELIMTGIKELHDSLYSPELDRRIDQVEEPFENTFKWVYDLPAFTTWLQEGSGLFWIHGKPGSGKSTLMKFIYKNELTWDLLHDWTSDALEIKAGFFFHYRGTALQKSFEGVLRSLIIQLLAPIREAFWRQHGELWSDFEALRKRQAGLDRQIHDLQEALQRTKSKMFDLAEQKSHQADTEMSIAAGYRVEVTETKEELEKSEKKICESLEKVAAKRDSTDELLRPLANRFRPYATDPETVLLAGIAAQFRALQHGFIRTLENILHRILDQDKVKMDVVLFFDALDEFNGHLDTLSRFLQRLGKRPSTSSTRIKVCFSSRPWEQLRKYFSHCPGFRLQDYTRHDIEEYAAGKLAHSQVDNSLISPLAPAVITRANGVFLWVGLALKELLNFVVSNPDAATRENLEGVLQRLPDDLHAFYALMIERISSSNRRRTFALLELLIRQTAPPVLAADIRDAVLIESCNTFDQAILELQSHRRCHLGLVEAEKDLRLRADISTWGGGLVEINTRDNGEITLQLLHQTVMEFATGLDFKRLVLGDRAAISHENGHSLYLKYLICNKIDERHFFIRRRRPHVGSDGLTQKIFHHAEQHELTTGTSQIDFIISIPPDRFKHDFQMQLEFQHGVEDPASSPGPMTWNHLFLLYFATLNGLTLCLRDWISEHPGTLARLCQHFTKLPLLNNLIFQARREMSLKRHLKAMEMLVDAGFPDNNDLEFLDNYLGAICGIEFGGIRVTDDFAEMSKPVLHDIANIIFHLPKNVQQPWDLLRATCDVPGCVEPHLQTSMIIQELIRRGADPFARYQSRQTMDWVLGFLFPDSLDGHKSWDLGRRYYVCTTLLSAATWQHATPDSWLATVTEFEKAGYDTGDIRQDLRISTLQTVSGAAWAPSVRRPAWLSKPTTFRNEAGPEVTSNTAGSGDTGPGDTKNKAKRGFLRGLLNRKKR